MKICWDNLEGLKLTEYSKREFVKKSKNGWPIYYNYIDNCAICDEAYLRNSRSFGSCCSSSCHNKLHPAQPHRERKTWDHGEGHMVGQLNNKIHYIHRKIAEKVMGRQLKRNEVVHHINMEKDDNRNSNLMICDSSYHMWLHNRMAKAWAEDNLIKSNKIVKGELR